MKVQIGLRWFPWGCSFDATPFQQGTSDWIGILTLRSTSSHMKYFVLSLALAGTYVRLNSALAKLHAR